MLCAAHINPKPFLLLNCKFVYSSAVSSQSARNNILLKLLLCFPSAAYATSLTLQWSLHKLVTLGFECMRSALYQTDIQQCCHLQSVLSSLLCVQHCVTWTRSNEVICNSSILIMAAAGDSCFLHMQSAPPSPAKGRAESASPSPSSAPGGSTPPSAAGPGHTGHRIRSAIVRPESAEPRTDFSDRWRPSEEGQSRSSRVSRERSSKDDSGDGHANQNGSGSSYRRQEHRGASKDRSRDQSRDAGHRERQHSDHHRAHNSSRAQVSS